jgi:transposase
MKSRRKYDQQFKRDAVSLLESSGKAVGQIADDLGIRYDLLSRWRKELGDVGKKAFTGNGNSRDEEMLRLRKENAELKMERDILKKAVAIFSVHEK